jgi:hypothetical protein
MGGLAGLAAVTGGKGGKGEVREGFDGKGERKGEGKGRVIFLY